MELVLDNNILFSLMKPDSVNSYLFSSLKAEFLAPEFIKDELENNKTECLLKSTLSEQEFETRQAEVESNIRFFDSSKYSKFLKKSKEALSDPDDIDFLVLALSKNAAIWSNDPHLKEQSLVPVYATSELIDKL